MAVAVIPRQWRPLIAAMAILALTAGVGIGGAVAQSTPPQSSGCTSAIFSLSPCLGYITANNSNSKPSQGCCSALDAVVKSSAGCLCQLLGSSNPLGFSVNRTQALALPGACNVKTPPVSQCTAAGVPAEAPAGSPGSNPPGATAGSKGATDGNVFPGAKSPSSAPSNNIPPTNSGQRNIPSSSTNGVNGGAVAVFTPPALIVFAVVGVVSASISFV